jgi:hypothetical protein
MSKKPSQVPAPGAMGGAGPGSPNLGRPAPQDTLPIKEGWGSKEGQGCPIKKTIEEVLKTNEWLNGDFDFFEGDLSALGKDDEFRDWTEVEDVEELRQKIRNYTGTFKYKNVLFFSDYHYGVFVYKIPDGQNYLEHLNPDISLEKLIEVILRLDG